MKLNLIEGQNWAMDTLESKLSSILNDIEENCDPLVNSDQCNRFSFECLILIRHRLPPIVLEALVVLNEYLAGHQQLQSITEMLAKLWLRLGEHRLGQNLDRLEVYGIRAVIFPLDAQTHAERRDIVDHLSFFLSLVNKIEPHFEEEEVLLRKHFVECLGKS